MLERIVPQRLRRFVPSPASVGIATVMPGSNAIAMFIGASLAALARRQRPDFAERSLVPIASGPIAGESLTGATLALHRALGVSV